MRQRYFRVPAPLVLLIGFLIQASLAAPALAQQRTLCVHGIEAPAALNVRAGPGPDSRVIARFPAKACGVKLAGRCSGDWCQMVLGQTSGWVKTKHIGVYELPGGGQARRAAVAAPVEAPTQDVTEGAARGPVLAERPAPAKRPQRRTPVQARAVVEQGSSDDGACVRRVDSDDTLRIRRGPGTGHDEIGDIPPKACGVSVSDACEGRWCRISWHGRRGWANTHYLD